MTFAFPLEKRNYYYEKKAGAVCQRFAHSGTYSLASLCKRSLNMATMFLVGK